MSLDQFADPIMVVVAHPDDIEAHCAGTIIQLLEQGKRVGYVLATSGNCGTSDPAMSAERLGGLRESEQRAAAEIVGVRDLTFLRYEDGDLTFHVPELRADLTRLIRQYRPRTVITHDPYPGNGSLDSCAIYPDHTTLGLTVFQAAYLRAPSPLCEPKQLREGLPLHKLDMLMLIMSGAPDVFVDIEAVFDRRIQALRQYKTQGRDRPEVDAFFRRIARQLGEHADYTLAEGFRRLAPT
ncbi:MAG: PIG-L family deacetylase [Chloroflexi bacterium]|nr:PIG-L family deacetylase [Chloroflexota bacterium]